MSWFLAFAGFAALIILHELGHFAAARAGGTAPCILNAANEVAVHAFLSERLGFLGIPAVIEAALERLPARRVHSFDTLYQADAEARRVAAESVAVPRRKPVTSPPGEAR